MLVTISVLLVLCMFSGCRKKENQQMNAMGTESRKLNEIEGMWQPLGEVLGFSTENVKIGFEENSVYVYDKKSENPILKGSYNIDEVKKTVTVSLDEFDPTYEELLSKVPKKLTISYVLSGDDLKLKVKDTVVNFIKKE